ncbi:chymotrypsin-1-like [Hyposmocoma kahamanoa]|uniref:chymotrypsin-1-like n=1 Tax=Hyposmocoma kahamanoa TaxID=1477025 RepID=UPI000E6D808F|nr:chymotrypsin-1-like [Hyposmocoma kahamanoa]
MLLFVMFFFVRQVRVGEALLQGYVNGGSYSKLQTFPHTAFLSVSCQRDQLDVIQKEWFCGASVIHKLALLTAAHCLNGCFSSKIVAAVSNALDRRFTYPAKDAHVHSAYNVVTFENDIAIVELGHGVTFNEFIKPAILKRQLRFRVLEAFLPGWGYINLSERREGTALKQTRQEVFSRTLCTELLGNLPAADFCAGNDHISHHTATESGSSLVAYSEEGDINIGIITYHMPNITRTVHVFTFLPMYYQWITDKINNIQNGIAPESTHGIPSAVITTH